MAKKKKEEEKKIVDIDAFTEDLMSELNKEMGEKLFLNLAKDNAPTDVKYWVPTSSELLDWICSGIPNGGFPGGKLVEISGPASIGKSHIAYQIARSVQKRGGITCYIDTESATAKDNLKNLGVDFGKSFAFIQHAHTIERVFEVVEAFVEKASKVGDLIGEDVPLCVVIDSIGGIDSKHELDRDRDKVSQPGVNAKAIKRNLNKVMNNAGITKALFVIVNQQYYDINAAKWEKKTKTRGGNGIPYAADIRLELEGRGGGKAFVYAPGIDHPQALREDIPPVGIRVKCKSIKNRITTPFRTVEFEIHFGIGIKEHNQKWELMKRYSPIELPDGREVHFTDKSWKSIGVYDKDGEESYRDKWQDKNLLEQKMYVNRSIVTECVNVVMKERMKTLGTKKVGDHDDPESPSLVGSDPKNPEDGLDPTSLSEFEAATLEDDDFGDL